MKERVEYCENSNITEAWSVMIGAPGEVRDSDVGALENIASKNLGDFQPQPSFIVVEKKKDDKIVPPFWHKQLSYDNGKYAVRLGHRYLSVHFIKQGADYYKKYDCSLEPQVDAWLEAYAEMVNGKKEPQFVEKVGFGYVNIFKFPILEFDLSKYFKISFGTSAESAENGLSGLNIEFKINDSEKNSSVTVNISVMSEHPESDKIVIVTKVEAYKIVNDSCSFEDKDKILGFVSGAKEVAKSVFFDLATKETHDLMGAKYDSVTA